MKKCKKCQFWGSDYPGFESEIEEIVGDRINGSCFLKPEVEQRWGDDPACNEYVMREICVE